MDFNSNVLDAKGLVNLWQQPTEADKEIVARQIGREPRGVLAVAARCSCGAPAVVATLPRLPDGTPFPTSYYLTLPAAVVAASRLEASGVMADLSLELKQDAHLASAYGNAHSSYLRDREWICRISNIASVEEISNFSAGGMPERVKCLHALLAHSLAVGAGVNPIGDRVLTKLAKADSFWKINICQCQSEE